MTDPSSSRPGLLGRTLTIVSDAGARFMALPLIARLVAIAAIAGGFLLFVLFLGFEVNQHKVFPAGLFTKVDNKLQTTIFSTPPPEPIHAGTTRTTLIDLRLDLAPINTGRDLREENMLSESGGGLTSFGDDVLLLPYDGNIYAAASSEDVRQTRIAGPDIGRTGYFAAIEDPAFEDYFFQPGYLRYNDIEYFQNEGGHGLIASFTEYHAERQCYTNSLARLDLPAGITSIDEAEATQADWTTFFRTEPCLPFKDRHYALEGQMASGRIVFEAPATLYLTSGDFHWDGMRADGELIAQNPEAEYGKVLKIDIDSGDSAIVSMGHRNMQGMTFTEDGQLYIAEHGPNGGDELNLIEEGLNYGWPLASLGISYSGAPLPDAEQYGRHAGFAQPVYAWVPSPAISALIQVKGFDPAWDGDLLAGSLLGQSLFRIRMEEGRVLYSERIPFGVRIRDLHQHTDGRIVVWTDEMRLIFISPQPRIDHTARLNKHIAYWDFPDRRADRLRATVANCAECHSFTIGDHAKSPSLARIYGSPIGATSYPAYSEALSSKGGTWTREALIAYLTDPQAFAPGTSMLAQQFPDRQTLDDLLGYLEGIEQDF